MKIYGQLENASIELLSAAPGTAVAGRIYFNTTTGKAMVDDGTNQRALLRNDQACVIGNNGTAANNVRVNRAANAKIQFVTGSDATAEGSDSTALAQVGSRVENYSTAGRPAAASAGRLILDTDLVRLVFDTGAAWSTIATGMTTKGDILYSSDNAGSSARLGIGSAGTVLGVAAGVPAWITNPGVPTGTLIDYMGSSAPAGYQIADGTAISRTTYSNLYAVIGTSFGIGDGSTTFNLPDLRGRFTRGFSSASSNDPDKTTRTAQTSGTFTVGSGATTNGSSTITVADTSNLALGMTVSGTGIPASSVVHAILTSTTFTLGDLANSANVNATATNTGLTFTFSKSATGNYPGSVQSFALQDHHHTMTGDFVGVGQAGGGAFDATGGPTSTSNVVSATVSTETRPLNITVLCCIRDGT